jgi:hypothetical protein
MESQANASLLAEAARQHRGLIERAAATRWEDVVAVLNIGAAVALHGLLERAVIFPASKYLSVAAAQQRIDDHERLAAELGCLEELSGPTFDDGSGPARGDDGDLEAMSRAVLDRLRSHLERDERVLYRPLVSLGLISAADFSRQSDKHQ